MRPQLSAQQLLQGPLKLSIQLLPRNMFLNVQPSASAEHDKIWQPSCAVVSPLTTLEMLLWPILVAGHCTGVLPVNITAAGHN